MTLNRSGRSFADEIRAYAAWLGSDVSAERVRVLDYDYSRDGDWWFRDAPEVEAAAFEGILRSATCGWVNLCALRGSPGTLTVALEYISDPHGRELTDDARVRVIWSDTLAANHPKRLETVGMAVLTTGRMPGPPAPPYEVGVAYPLAYDICDGIAAVSFAVLDLYPDIDHGWWCMVEQFARVEGNWEMAGGSHDNTTSPAPFERPVDVEACELDWIDWPSNGGWGGWENEPRERHSSFGIAPVRTARLTVTTGDGHEREVRITPWNGAYVVVAPGTHSILTGYDEDGSVLGTLSSG